MIKYTNKNPSGWRALTKIAMKMRNKRSTEQCWAILIEKMERRYRIGNPLLNSMMWKARI